MGFKVSTISGSFVTFFHSVPCCLARPTCSHPGVCKGEASGCPEKEEGEGGFPED